MKRVFVFFLLLLLVCHSAGAETIAQQIGAPETCQAAYDSNTGRTKITVDAAVRVPEVDVIPTYAVTARDFTVEEGIRLTCLLHPDMNWERFYTGADLPFDTLGYSRSGTSGQYESAEWFVRLADPYDAHVMLYNSYITGLFNRQPTARRLTYQWSDPKTHLFFYDASSFGHPETMGISLQGQPLTLEEATAMANDFMQAMAPDYELRTVYGTEGEKGDGKVYKTLAYCFTYTRSVGGVPITYADYSRISTDFVDTAMAPAPGQEFIILVIHENRIVNFRWEDPYELGDMLQDKTELLPFEKILRIFGTIAPLSVQSTENSTGRNGLHITEIRLGYMPVLCRDHPDQWELRPVWDFMGSRILPLETYDWPDCTYLTIDAIDGTVIDRNYGY